MFGFTAKTPEDIAKAELRGEEMDLLGDMSRMELAESHVLYHQSKINRLQEYVHLRSEGLGADEKHDGKRLFSRTPTERAIKEMNESEVSVLHYLSEFDRAKCLVDYRVTKIKRLREFLGMDTADVTNSETATATAEDAKASSKRAMTKSMRVLGAV